jgi:glycosyltransferase involved in cell wall biosynthesis
MSEELDLTVVVTLLNEAESLPVLQTELLAELERLSRSFEIIYCDDGSSDESMGVLRDFAAQDERVRVISFRKNFGQTAGLEAGFRHARGRVIVPMDADLQNDPKDIGRLLEKIDEGYDVVSGWRKNRKDAFFSVTFPSRVGNAVIRKITGVKLHDFGCTLKAYRREILQDVRLYGEMHRFIPVWAAKVGAKITELEVNHRPRSFGSSKYRVTKAMRVMLDLITVRFLVAYSTKPLYFFGRFGLVLCALATGFWSWAVVKKVIWLEPFFTDPFFTAGIFCGLAGLQLLIFGLLSELIMRTYYEAQDKPTYSVRETVNMPADPPARIEPKRR